MHIISPGNKSYSCPTVLQLRPMCAMASQFTGNNAFCSTVCSAKDKETQRILITGPLFREYTDRSSPHKETVMRKAITQNSRQCMGYIVHGNIDWIFDEHCSPSMLLMLLSLKKTILFWHYLGSAVWILHTDIDTKSIINGLSGDKSQCDEKWTPYLIRPQNTFKCYNR